MATLTVFANFRINSDERFLRLQDSFRSFKDIDAEKWVINVRGKHQHAVIAFLREHLGDRLTASMRETERGWFRDTEDMLPDIKSDFVFVWIEDHINLIEVTKYREILDEMKQSGSELLWYTWWLFGDVRNCYRNIEKEEYPNISSFLLDRDSRKKIIPGIVDPCSIILPCILSERLFKKVITKNPRIFRWNSRFVPYEFEKRPEDMRWLPIQFALPKYELFASVDDDIGCEGYSLQSRGMYPTRITRERKRSAASASPKNPSGIKSGIKKILPPTLWFYLKIFRRGMYLIVRGQ